MRFALVLVLLLGCRDAVAPTPTLVGRYVLQDTPILLSFVAGEWYGYTEGVVWLHADSTFADTAVTLTQFLPTGGTYQTWVGAGRWSADTMAIAHDTLTRTVPRYPTGSVTLKYVRQ